MGPAFKAALRGYDASEVEIRAAAFPLRLRGYDRAQVDRVLADIATELG